MSRSVDCHGHAPLGLSDADTAYKLVAGRAAVNGGAGGSGQTGPSAAGIISEGTVLIGVARYPDARPRRPVAPVMKREIRSVVEYAGRASRGSADHCVIERENAEKPAAIDRRPGAVLRVLHPIAAVNVKLVAASLEVGDKSVFTAVRVPGAGGARKSPAPAASSRVRRQVETVPAAEHPVAPLYKPVRARLVRRDGYGIRPGLAGGRLDAGVLARGLVPVSRPCRRALVAGHDLRSFAPVQRGIVRPPGAARPVGGTQGIHHAHPAIDRSQRTKIAALDGHAVGNLAREIDVAVPVHVLRADFLRPVRVDRFQARGEHREEDKENDCEGPLHQYLAPVVQIRSLPAALRTESTDAASEKPFRQPQALTTSSLSPAGQTPFRQSR